MLRAWRSGDPQAFEALIPLVYDELHRVAVAQMRLENPGHTLTPTGLLHESFLKLMQSDSPPDWQDRKHFFVVAARAMRQHLVDHARRKHAAKRQADPTTNPPHGPSPIDVIDLDRALESLHLDSPRRAQMLELRYFGGLELKDIAEVLDVSIPTVSRELKLSEAWLALQLRNPENPNRDSRLS
jgi:RNA polymerase sigma factor (TIGR02999 family)